MNEIDFIILNCFGTLTNIMINSEILELSKKHYQDEKVIMESILSELKKLNKERNNGN